MTATEWELALTLQRLPSERKRGPIDDMELSTFLNKLYTWANQQGFALGGSQKPKRTNCPHCGRIIRSISAKRCPMCGINLETGKVR